ncbi:MAG: sulfatase-like hydrolase/transferase [Bacteroidota bacterium]
MKTKGTVLYLALLMGLSLMAQEAERPNIVLIMCDDLGWADVGFNGNADIATPHLDRLAAQGAIFKRFYSGGAVCSPTRASCLTGRNPYRMGIYTANAGHMKPQEITLPELLQGAGYATGHFGKWHLGTLTTTIEDSNRGRPRDFSHYSPPSANGYNAYFVTEAKVPTYDPMIRPRVFDTLKGENLRFGWAAVEDRKAPKELMSYGSHYWYGREQLELNNLEGSDSRVIMDRVMPFVRSTVRAHQPFFAAVWFHTPHLPLVATKVQRDRYAHLPYKQQLLYASITSMDEQVGRLWAQLEALGQAENTMLWFCSDNGPENGTPGSSGPFRERKRSLYEGGVRVPGFVIWPNKIKAGTLDFPAVTSDYLPTILDYLDMEYPDDRPLDGISLKEALEGRIQKREKAIGFQNGKKRSWVSQQYKLISNDGGETYELYNLIQDKGETRNIAEKYKNKVNIMKADLLAWIQSCRQSDAEMDY